eukprot:COSAG03_NODE_4782_length_1435_cov_27.407934_1_plen_177_part_00
MSAIRFEQLRSTSPGATAGAEGFLVHAPAPHAAPRAPASSSAPAVPLSRTASAPASVVTAAALASDVRRMLSASHHATGITAPRTAGVPAEEIARHVREVFSPREAGGAAGATEAASPGKSTGKSTGAAPCTPQSSTPTRKRWRAACGPVACGAGEGACAFACGRGRLRGARGRTC